MGLLFFVTFVSITHSERGIWSRKMFTSHHFQRHYQNCESASTPQLGMSHKKCLRGFGGNGNIAWTSAVSHVGRMSNGSIAWTSAVSHVARTSNAFNP